MSYEGLLIVLFNILACLNLKFDPNFAICFLFGTFESITEDMAQKYGYTVKNKTLFVFSLILNQTKKVKLVRVHLEVRVERLLWVPLLELEVKIEKN